MISSTFTFLKKPFCFLFQIKIDVDDVDDFYDVDDVGHVIQKLEVQKLVLLKIRRILKLAARLIDWLVLHKSLKKYVTYVAVD